MKLSKALQVRKKLIGEIAKLKTQIRDKNSYLEGSKNAEKYDVKELYKSLLSKIDELVGLKYTIIEANKEIQSKILVRDEYKGLISFLKELNVTEGSQVVGYSKENMYTYKVHIDEKMRDELITTCQTTVEALQEEIDTFNYTTEIPWKQDGAVG